jgi:hypothetical protein
MPNTMKYAMHVKKMPAKAPHPITASGMFRRGSADSLASVAEETEDDERQRGEHRAVLERADVELYVIDHRALGVHEQHRDHHDDGDGDHLEDQARARRQLHVAIGTVRDGRDEHQHHGGHGHHAQLHAERAQKITEEDRERQRNRHGRE